MQVSILVHLRNDSLPIAYLIHSIPKHVPSNDLIKYFVFKLDKLVGLSLLLCPKKKLDKPAVGSLGLMWINMFLSNFS